MASASGPKARTSPTPSTPIPTGSRSPRATTGSRGTEASSSAASIYLSGYASQTGAYVGRPFALQSAGCKSPVDFTLPSTMPWVVVNLPTNRKGTATLRLRE